MEAANGKRLAWLDFLRVLACFFVIVNHTNSLVFKATVPQDAQWWLSIAWYYLSKLAVPLFVMVSGACLLPKQESYKRVGLRVLRMAIILLLFSYLYYAVGVLQKGLSWRALLGVKTFLCAVWQSPITDSYWYLYFYIGLLLMLPLLRRMAQAMTKRDMQYLMAGCFGVSALWPLLTHYASALTLPGYLYLPLFSGYIGLFFAGLYIRLYAKPRALAWPIALLVLSIALSTLLTRLELDRVAPGEKYWFMDDRTAPSLLTIAGALAVALLSRDGFARREPLSERTQTLWRVLGSCAFGGYLLQDLAIALTRHRLFEPLSAAIPPFAAALLWELLVFAVVIAAAWLLRRLPLLRKLL